MISKTLNDYRSNESLIRQLIPNFDSYTPEERERARLAYTRKWTSILVNEFGADSDSALDGSNPWEGNGSEIGQK